MKKNKYSFWKKVAALWIVFSVPYVLYSQYNVLKNIVADAAYERGLAAAVSQLINQAQNCTPIPVRLHDQMVEVINVKCVDGQKMTK